MIELASVSFGAAFDYQHMQMMIERLWSQANETQQQAYVSLGQVGRINIYIGSVQNITENIQYTIKEAESYNNVIELECKLRTRFYMQQQYMVD